MLKMLVTFREYGNSTFSTRCALQSPQGLKNVGITEVVKFHGGITGQFLL